MARGPRVPFVRLDQCVTPSVAGGLVNVATTTCSADTVRGRPGRSRSRNAADPPAAYRPRHNSTVGRLTPTSEAISVFERRSDASNTIRARRANPDSTVEARTQPSKTARSGSTNNNGSTRMDITHSLNQQP